MTRMRLRADCLRRAIATSGNRMTERVKRDGTDRKSKKRRDRPIRFANDDLFKVRSRARDSAERFEAVRRRYVNRTSGTRRGKGAAGCRVEFAFERRVDSNQACGARCAPELGSASPRADPCRKRKRDSTTWIRELGL